MCQTLYWSLLMVAKFFMLFALRFLGNICYTFINNFIVLSFCVSEGRLYEAMNMIMQWKWVHLTCIEWSKGLEIPVGSWHCVKVQGSYYLFYRWTNLRFREVLFKISFLNLKSLFIVKTNDLNIIKLLKCKSNRRLKSHIRTNSRIFGSSTT